MAALLDVLNIVYDMIDVSIRIEMPEGADPSGVERCQWQTGSNYRSPLETYGIT